ncbi:MAG: MFS transporter [Peptococcaceae bacterium]|nr:MFS transporter [Peptococcaceae bacterium]
MSVIKSLFAPYRGLPREVYVIFVARIINALGFFVMPLLTIILTNNIGLSQQAAGFYISLSGLLYLPAAMLGGKLSDSWGRKKIIILFDLLSAVLYLICGFIQPSMLMVYLLMVAGMCMGAAGPAHDSLMADLTTPQTRNGAYALSYLGFNMGFAIGPVLGGFLYHRHLPLVFIGDALTALVALTLICVFIKETIQTTRAGSFDASRELEKREQGSIFAILLKRPILIYFAVIAFGYNFAYAQWSFLLPLQFVQQFKALGVQYYGWMAGFNGLIVMLFTPLVTRFVTGTPYIRRAVYGGLLYATGFGLLSLWSRLGFFFISCFIFTLGEIVLSISITPFVINHTPISHRGRMSAVLPMIMGLGYTIGPIGMGNILAYTTIERGWLLIGVSTLLFTCLMYGLERWDRREECKTREECAECAVMPHAYALDKE